MRLVAMIAIVAVIIALLYMVAQTGTKEAEAFDDVTFEPPVIISRYDADAAITTLDCDRFSGNRCLVYDVNIARARCEQDPSCRGYVWNGGHFAPILSEPIPSKLYSFKQPDGTYVTSDKFWQSDAHLVNTGGGISSFDNVVDAVNGCNSRGDNCEGYYFDSSNAKYYLTKNIRKPTIDDSNFYIYRRKKGASQPFIFDPAADLYADLNPVTDYSKPFEIVNGLMYMDSVAPEICPTGYRRASDSCHASASSEENIDTAVKLCEDDSTCGGVVIGRNNGKITHINLIYGTRPKYSLNRPGDAKGYQHIFIPNQSFDPDAHLDASGDVEDGMFVNDPALINDLDDYDGTLSGRPIYHDKNSAKKACMNIPACKFIITHGPSVFYLGTADNKPLNIKGKDGHFNRIQLANPKSMRFLKEISSDEECLADSRCMAVDRSQSPNTYYASGNFFPEGSRLIFEKPPNTSPNSHAYTQTGGLVYAPYNAEIPLDMPFFFHEKRATAL